MYQKLAYTIYMLNTMYFLKSFVCISKIGIDSSQNIYPKNKFVQSLKFTICIFECVSLTIYITWYFKIYFRMYT